MPRTALWCLALAACIEPRDQPGTWQDWYDPGTEFDLEEPVRFTDVNYDFVGTDPIETIPTPGDFETWFAPSDPPPSQCSGWRTDSALPLEITGIVTVYPRMYMKVPGCLPADDFSVDSDQKFYGSFYLQDRTGGFFVLGNTRVAHFDMGDRITLRVRALKEYFDSVMVPTWDLVDVQRDDEAIYYREVSDRVLGPEDQAEVVRVTGVVAGEMSNFGEIYLCAGDDPDTTLVRDPTRSNDMVPACALSSVTSPPWFKVGLDVELQRRGHRYAPGEHIQVTGPAHLSFGDYQVTVMRLGQIERLDR